MRSSIRWKIALAMAIVALVATSSVGVIGYRSTSIRLVDEVDRSIVQATALLAARPDRLQIPARDLLDIYAVRVVDNQGRTMQTSFDDTVPVDDVLKSVLGQPRERRVSNTSVGGIRYRVHTIGLQSGAVQVARPLTETDSVLRDIRQRTLLLVIAVSALAAALGWLLAGSVVAPLRRLTGAAVLVEQSGTLDVDVPGGGRDEVGRLGTAFRGMLGALQRSRAEQQRLVQDAGHELRTPLTSLRTNLAVMRRHPELPDVTKQQILDDLDGEVSELTDLVNELVAVASGHLADQPAQDLHLAAVAEDVSARVGRRRGRDIGVRVTAPAIVRVPRAGLERAITNLIENAVKFDRTGPIEVVVDGASLTVLDGGPGIPAEDLDRVFDRFHRAESARTLPGSGLGLAIVREVVERHGGTVTAASRPEGGAAVGFSLPPIP
ncbi:MAG: HAMP domain-containing histidine kinase [Ilumatobacter sp.]|nr:HAMP domain-containing histidine kinase [Ilumatobacter sp.]